MDLQGISLGAVLIGVLIWFIKGLISDIKNQLKDLKSEVDENKTEILLLKQETHSTKTYFNEKFEVLFKGIEQINLNIQKLNEK